MPIISRVAIGYKLEYSSEQAPQKSRAVNVPALWMI
jgi:hypothetical protein